MYEFSNIIVRLNYRIHPTRSCSQLQNQVVIKEEKKSGCIPGKNS